MGSKEEIRKVSYARTVCGDVPIAELGFVYGHEHLMIQGGLGVMNNPALRLDNIDHAVTEVNDCMKLGAKTFVDFMPLDSGRHPEALVQISQQTGAHIIAATGFHKPMYYDDIHWTYHYTVEQIAALLVAECEEGMDRHSYNGPLVERIAAKAGVIKCASDYHVIAPLSRKLFEAAAIAHLQTGIPIATHTEHGTCGLEQIRLLQDLGVSPSDVIICHMDRNPDLGLHKELASTGCYLEYDHATRVKYHADSTSIALIRGMFEAGYEQRLLLGTDFALRTYWKAYSGGPGMAHLLDYYVPRLIQEGLPRYKVYAMMTTNAQQAYAIRQ